MHGPQVSSMLITLARSLLPTYFFLHAHILLSSFLLTLLSKLHLPLPQTSNFQIIKSLAFELPPWIQIRISVSWHSLIPYSTVINLNLHLTSSPRAPHAHPLGPTYVSRTLDPHFHSSPPPEAYVFQRVNFSNPQNKSGCYRAKSDCLKVL